MKTASTILLSLLLLGVCSGRIVDTEQQRIDDEQFQQFRKLKLMDDMRDVHEMRNIRSMSKFGDIENSMGEKENDDAAMKRDMEDKREMVKLRDTDRSMKYDKNYDDIMRRDRDESQKLQSERRMQKAFSNLPTLSGLRSYISQKFVAFLNMVYGYENSDDRVGTIYSFSLPSFADPLDVGNVADNSGLAKAEYKNVELHGLSYAYQASYRVDVNSKKAVLTIPLQYINLTGQYVISNLMRHTSGNFNITLYGDVAYVENIAYEYMDGQVHVGASNAEIRYGSVKSHYENIGYFSHLFHNTLGRHFLSTVTAKVYDEINPKMAAEIQHQLEEVSKNLKRAQITSALQHHVQDVVDDIKNVFAHGGDVSVDFTDSFDTHYQNMHVKFTSVKLHGIENFFLAGNRITYSENNINSKVILSLANATATVMISYHEGTDENVPGQETSAEYTVSNLYAYVNLHKEVGVPGVHLRGTDVHVDSVMVSSSHDYNYEGVVGNVIRHMASPLKAYIQHGLEDVIAKEVSAILARGDTFSPTTYTKRQIA